MAREITRRVIITATLETLTAIHVGGGEDPVGVDLALARDGDGNCCIPATSIAGVLRGWHQTAHGAISTNALWGYQERAAAGRRAQGHASFITVDDAKVAFPRGSRHLTRDGVAIDPYWSTAKYGQKYDREIIPAGSTVELRLIFDERATPAGAHGSGAQMDVDSAVAATLRTLRFDDLRLGAAVTRGFGRVRMTGGITVEQRLDDRDEMLALLDKLAAGQPDERLSDIGDAQPIVAAGNTLQTDRVAIEVEWCPDGPLMVKAGFDGFAADAMPLVEPDANGVALLLPGSSIKGALRADAERILRTVVAPPAGSPAPPRALALAEYLFGREKRRKPQRAAGDGEASSGSSAAEAAVAAPGQQPARGALYFEDCFGRAGPLTAKAWQEILLAPDELHSGESGLQSQLTQHKLSDWSHAYHVAIDRWTGGAAEGLLFSSLEPGSTEWAPIRLQFDAGILGPWAEPAFALLLLALENLSCGRLPLGFATNRGMGALTVSKVTIRGLGRLLPEVGLPNGEIVVKGPLKVADLDPGVREPLASAWRKWLTGQEGSDE